MSDLSFLPAGKRLRMWIDDFQRVEAEAAALSSNEEAAMLAAMSEDEVRAALNALNCDVHTKIHTRSVLGIEAARLLENPRIDAMPRATNRIIPRRTYLSRASVRRGVGRTRRKRYTVWSAMAAVFVVATACPVILAFGYCLKQDINKLSSDFSSVRNNLTITSERVSVLEAEQYAAAPTALFSDATFYQEQGFQNYLDSVTWSTSKLGVVQPVTDKKDLQRLTNPDKIALAKDVGNFRTIYYKPVDVDAFIKTDEYRPLLSKIFKQNLVPILASIK